MLPSTVKILHAVKTQDGWDEDGYRTEAGHAPFEDRYVISVHWEPPQSSVTTDSPDRVLDELVVLTSEPEVFGHGDQIKANGELYEVVKPRDWRLGPFDFKPGGEVRARRVEG